MTDYLARLRALNQTKQGYTEAELAAAIADAKRLGYPQSGTP
jgi:hypothetical protein